MADTIKRYLAVPIDNPGVPELFRQLMQVEPHSPGCVWRLWRWDRKLYVTDGSILARTPMAGAAVFKAAWPNPDDYYPPARPQAMVRVAAKMLRSPDGYRLVPHKWRMNRGELDCSAGRYECGEGDLAEKYVVVLQASRALLYFPKGRKNQYNARRFTVGPARIEGLVMPMRKEAQE